MQTTSGKVKLATAEEVDNMASSISGGLGGTLIGTTCAYIERTLNVSLPVAGDYVIVKSLTFGNFGGSGGANYTGIKTNDGVTLLYKGGTGYIATATAATAALDASGKTIKFTSMINSYNFNTYVNIEIYKFN